ncbi:enolase-phosphatase E1 [Monomorium pharaonis]|uniref:enolase-phosphatase E1 n=1 Tax=Monomorium pharaonis TaxID=307658 RepID=UPI00063EDECC|nr:enolase-phosphatase E1 [Monomorium pharaonis]
MAGEKRSQDQDEISSARTVLVDIEGTTTSISFVKETLFPYVRQNLKDYIETKWEDEEFKQDYEKLKDQAKKDEEDKLDGFVAITGDKPEEEKDSLLKNILWQMDNDRKTGALKQLQGHMWREAYKTGAVKGHVYEDVPTAFEVWTRSGKKIYVYSSGSVEAQKLLFGHSVHGDLLKHFSGFFDTEVGAKQESDSYKNILSKINEKASDVIFLTDVVKEATAARKAGLSTIIVVREGNAALSDEEKATYTTIKSFSDLTFQTSTKRQKLETTDDTADKGTADVSEPMDTSEDVEMSDVSDKKVEKNDTEIIESVEKKCIKDQPEDTSVSLNQAKEPIAVEKELSSIEQEMTQSDAKSKDKNEDTGSFESVKPVKDDTTTLTTKDDDKTTAKKTEENLDTIATEITTADDSISVSESVSKSETALTSSEKKIENSTDVAKDTQAESVDKIQTVEGDEKSDGIESQSQICDKNIANKSEECLTAKKDEEKNEAKITSDTSEKENTLTKNEQEVTKLEATATENGKTIETVAEKTMVSVTVTETEPTITDTRKEETASTEVTAEKNLEAITESEKVDEKAAQGIQTKTTDDKCENETTQETIKEEETVKEENVVDKDKNTVDSEKQKLNGTTQNGDTDVPVLDDKLHSNGLNEGSSKEATNEDAAAQNGEPESLSENSAESIKVKKVVDSAVADGAGESDVVPPVVVAATS